MLGKPASTMLMSLTAKAVVIWLMPPKSSMGFMQGRVMYHSSCHRLRMPSMAPASYSSASTFCSPAMKARNPTPRLSHSCTRISRFKLMPGSWNQTSGSRMRFRRISRPLAMP